MISPKSASWVVVHFPESCGAWSGRAAALRAYAAWAARQGQGVQVLVGEAHRAALEQALAGAAVQILGYRGDRPLTLPAVRPADGVLLVNGEELPRYDLAAVSELALESEGELTVFSPTSLDAAAHYQESVDVDESGEVLSFRRFYDDSPSYADQGSGDAAMIATTGEHLRAAAAQVAARGWGLESIGALSRRLTVRWTHERWTLSDAEAEVVLPPGQKTTSSGGVAAGSRASGAVAFNPARWDGQDTPSAERRLADLLARQPALRYEDAELLERREQPLYEGFKRGLDFVAALFGLLLLSPLLTIVAILVKLTSRGPVFFVHHRQGRGGKEFPCLKFRSMRQDAHELQAALRQQNQVDGPQFKIERDPRETPIGRWLRRYNIDEVPQLFNVLAGHMSLVGPRPSPDSENQMCPAWRRARLSVRPGVTGLWQVLRLRENPDLDFQEWIYYDVEYAKHRSFWLDFMILINTPVAMFRRHHLWHFVEYLRKRGICTHAGEMGWDAYFAAMRESAPAAVSSDASRS